MRCTPFAHGRKARPEVGQGRPAFCTFLAVFTLDTRPYITPRRPSSSRAGRSIIIPSGSGYNGVEKRAFEDYG